MAKSVISTHWYVRITNPHSVARPLVDQLVNSIDVSGCVVTFHTGKKTKEQHIHIALVMKNQLQKQSIDKRLQKLFGVAGAGKYSNKIWDKKLDALSYFYHDDEEVLYYNLPSLKALEPEILELSKKYKDIVAAAKQKASMKCVESILEESQRKQQIFRTGDIVRLIYAGVRQGKWYPPVGQQLERYVTEVLIKQGDEDNYLREVDFLVQNFERKFWR